MRTANNTNNYTVEGLVAKYRNFVKENAPKYTDWGTWVDKNGKVQVEEYERFWNDSDEYADIQLLIRLYHYTAKDKADKAVLESLSEDYDAYHEKALSNDEFEFLSEHFSEFVTYEFDHFSEWLGGNPFVSSTPKAIKKVVQDNITKGAKTIFVADTAFCDVATMFSGCKVYGFTGYCGTSKSFQSTWAIGQIRLFASRIDSRIVPGKYNYEKELYSYSLPPKESIDLIVYGTMWDSLCENIEDLFSLLKDGGKMIMFASKKNMAGKSKFYDFRHNLVSKRHICSISVFEEDGFIGERQDIILLCIEKTDHETVLVENVKRRISRIINAEMLDADLLWPSYYLTSIPKEGTQLSSLVSLYGGLNEYKKQLSLRKNGQLSAINDQFVVWPNDLSERYEYACIETKRLKKASDQMYEDWRDRMLDVNQPGICVYGNDRKLVVGYFNQMPKDKYVIDFSIPYLIPKRGIDSRYIAVLLLSSDVSQQITSICDGRITASMMSFILDKIIVPKHSPKERLSLLADANYNAFISTQKELKKNHEDSIKAIRRRKHTLTQSLSSMEAMFFSLNAFRIRHNGKLLDDDRISRVTDTTVKDAFEFLTSNFKDITVGMDHIADVDYSFNPPEWINPEAFIEDYIAKNGKGWLKFNPIITWEKGHNLASHDLKNSKTGQVILHKGNPIHKLFFPKDALERIFKNIVHNAVTHGFTDDKRNDYQVQFSWKTDGVDLSIEIENNGSPIPSDYDSASLIEYGVSTKLHQDGHNGIGCNEIDDIMQRYDGKVEIVSSPEKEFTVKYILTFKSNMSFYLISSCYEILRFNTSIMG